MKKTDLNIIGMHCASCSTLINRALTKTDGVSEANVNYATAKARVVYDENKLSENDLITIVKNKGYGASVGGKNDAIDKEASQKKEIDNIKNNLYFSLLFTIPAFLIGMVLMPLGVKVPYELFILFLLSIF